MAKNEVFGEMPHSLEAEQALLGCLLLDTRIQVEVAAYLKEEDFYAESHKYIFHAMDEIISDNKPVDMVTLTDALEKTGTLKQAGGIEYIAELTNVMPSSANYQRYVDIVTRDSMLRKLMRGSSQIIDVCKSSQDKASALSFAEKTVYDISNEADTSEIVKIGNVVNDVVAQIEDLSNGKVELQGIKTGYKGLDALLNGLHKSDLMILAARPAVGKTSFAMNIVESVALQGYSCAVFSLEMGKEQITERLLCSIANVSMGNTKRGKVDKKEWVKLARARDMLLNAKIFIDDSAIIRPREMISKCRRIKSRFGLDFVMVDYMQLMTPDKTRSSDSRQNEITEISRSLKILAKELNVPVLALSQLSRAVETRKGRPQLSDLRESGAIEQDADIVMFIHRPDKNATEKEIAEGKVQANVAEILVEKHRAGPTGVVKLYFKGECTKFLNLNEETGEPDSEVGAKKPVATVDGYESLPTQDAQAENESFPEPPPADYEDGYSFDQSEPIVKSVDDEIF